MVRDLFILVIPVTDLFILVIPITDPITDFYLLARLIIFLFGTDESSLGNDELNSLHKVVYVFQRIIGCYITRAALVYCCGRWHWFHWSHQVTAPDPVKQTPSRQFIVGDSQSTDPSRQKCALAADGCTPLHPSQSTECYAQLPFVDWEFFNESRLA